jgi:hypothetical protein
MVVLIPLRWIVIPVFVCGLLALMLLCGLGSDAWLRGQVVQCKPFQNQACDDVRRQAAERHLVEVAPR